MTSNEIRDTKYELPTPLPLQPEEHELLMPREKRSVAEWAEAERILSAKTTNYAGKWSHDYVPWAIEIMEALSDVGTREVWEMKCVQSAGTEFGLNFLGQSIDEDPAPFGIFMPTEKDAGRRVNTRIRPLFESTHSLQKHLPGGSLDAINIGKETILDHMIMYIGWMGSAAAMADNPICKIFVDEIGKVPAKTGKEADAINLLRDRQTTFPTRSKLFGPSTPVVENDLLDREYNTGDQRKNWVKCPYCNQRHITKWRYVDLDKDSVRHLLTPTDYLSGQCARYVCPHCEKRWSEHDRWAAVTAGRWAPRDCSVDPSGRIIGKVFSNPRRSYHVPSFLMYPGFMTMSKLAFEWAEAQVHKKAGDIGPLQNFINSRLAEPFEEREKETQTSSLTTHIGTHEPQKIPAGVQLITVGIDVQMDHVWAVVDGWGWMSEAWSIFETRIETGDTLELTNLDKVIEFLLMEWPLIDDPDTRLMMSKAAIDCNYRTDTIYDFCNKCQKLGIDLVPVRGDSSVSSKTYRAVKIAGGTMTRYDLNVDKIKDRVYRGLYESKVAGGGFFHLHKETTEDVLEQLASEEERIIRHGRGFKKTWGQKDRHKPNHLWDCRVYSTFAAELAGAYALRDPSRPKKRIKLSERQKQNRGQ